MPHNRYKIPVRTHWDDFLAQPNRDISAPFVEPDGSLAWYDLDRKLHRDNDLPAYVGSEEGNKVDRWYIHGKRHRLNKPAVIAAVGNEVWYLDDKQHRIGGPSAKYSSGMETWFQYGNLHRVDGPANIVPSMDIEDYYLEGVFLTYDDWLVKRTPFLSIGLPRYQRIPLI